MRVTCEKCGAAFSVDERLVPARGARAQCPKCRAVQIVRRPDSAAPGPLGGAPRPPEPAPSFSPPQPPRPPQPVPAPQAAAPAPSPAQPAADPFGGLFEAPAAPPPEPSLEFDFSRPGPAASQPAASPAAPQPGFGFDSTVRRAAPPEQGSRPPQAAPAARSGPSFGSGPLPPPPSVQQLFRQGTPFPPPPPPAQAVQAAPAAFHPFGEPSSAASFPTCRSCLKPLIDTIDSALGICAACREASQSPAPRQEPFHPPFGAAPAGPSLAAAVPPQAFPPANPPPQAVAAAPNPPGPVPAQVVPSQAAPAPEPTPAGAETPPAESDSLALDFSDQLKDEAPSSEPAAPEAGESAPRKRVSWEVSAAAQAAAAQIVASRSGTAAKAEKPRSKVVEGIKAFLALALTVTAGVLIYLSVAKPQVIKPNRAPPKPKLLPPVVRVLNAWKNEGLAAPTGKADEHLAKALELFAQDRAEAYQEAEKSMRSAVQLAPDDPRMLAFWVETLAAGRGKAATPDELLEARGVLDALLKQKPSLPALHRASAALYLAHGEDELARKAAEQGLRLAKKDEDRVGLLVLLGRTHAAKSGPLAIEKLSEAIRIQPDLRAALMLRARAYESQGKPAKALADANARLAVDPTHREAHLAKYRLLLVSGDLLAAREALEQYAAQMPKSAEPAILKAQLALAIDRPLLKEAEAGLKALLKNAEALPAPDRARALAVASALAKDRGDLKAAAEHAAAALAADPSEPSARFRALLQALAKGDGKAAREHFDACRGKLGDDAAEQLYLGRVELAEGRNAEAAAALKLAVEKAPSRLAPRLALAAALMKSGDEDGAWMAMRKALDLSPEPLARVLAMPGDFHEAPSEIARVAAQAFETKVDDGNWLRDIYAAVVRHHLGEPADKVAKALDKALQTDPTSLPGLLYRAQIELDRKRWDPALGFARRAAAVERQSGAALYLMGLAEEGASQPDKARVSFHAALEKDPYFFPANLALARLALQAGDFAQAASNIEKALLSAPDDLVARQLQFQLDVRAPEATPAQPPPETPAEPNAATDGEKAPAGGAAEQAKSEAP